MANTSISGSGGTEPCPSPCVFRQGTLLHFVSLHRVAMGVSDTLLGGKPAIDWHPVQGGVAILIGMFHAREPG